MKCVSLHLISFQSKLIFVIGHPNGSIEFISNNSCKFHFNSWSRSFSSFECENSILIASGFQDKNIRVWKISSQIDSSGFMLDSTIQVSLVNVLSGHTDWVNSVSFYNGNLASASFDGQVFLWKVNEKDFDIQCRLGSTAVEDDQSEMVGVKLISEK